MGVVALPTGFLALYAFNRAYVISSVVFGCLAVVVGVFGSVVDGMAAAVISNIKVCFNQAGVTWGDSTDLNGVICYIVYGYQHDLVCTDDNSCLFYDGKKNGRDIMITYKFLLQLAFVFDIAVTTIVFLLIIISCINLCCPHQFGFGYGDDINIMEPMALKTSNRRPAQFQVDITTEESASTTNSK